MRVFGIDPGSERTGYGCVDSDGQRHQLIACGAIVVPARATFPERLRLIHEGLVALIRECRPDLVAIENLFHAANVRSALKLGHARGVAMLAAEQAGIPVHEYPATAVKKSVCGTGHATKVQVQFMVTRLLKLTHAPEPADAADGVAAALAHLMGAHLEMMAARGNGHPRR